MNGFILMFVGTHIMCTAVLSVDVIMLREWYIQLQIQTKNEQLRR